MALSSKEKFSQNAHLFKAKLEALGCPYTDGVDESWVMDLLYKPGEHRIRLLQWMFSKFDSRLHDLLDPQFVSSDTKMDSRIQRLLYVASSLGLCSPEDADLIRGASSVSRQTAFIEQLLDMVYILDRSEDPHIRSMKSPGIVSEGTTLKDQFYSDCWFMDSLTEQGKIDTVLMSEAKLLPPDIMKQLNISAQQRAVNGEDAQKKVPDLTTLEESVANFTRDLMKQEEILGELKINHKLPHEDAPSTENMQRTMRLALSELSQLVIGFSYCFDNEIHQWCNKNPPQFTELGPAFKRIYGLLDNFVEMLSSISGIRGSHKSLCLQLPERVRMIADGVPQPRGGSDVGIEDFQGCVSILEDSLVRAEKTVSSFNTTVTSGLVKLT